MGRPCTLCVHPRRYEIDKALVESVPYRELAARYGTSPSALCRHRNGHLPPHLARAQEAAQARHVAKLEQHRATREEEGTRQAIDVVQQLRVINSACLEVLKQARETKQNGMLLRSVDRIHRQIELQAKLLGELDTRPTVNVLVAPEWHQIRQLIFVALEPHPQARAAVAQVLEALPGAGP